MAWRQKGSFTDASGGLDREAVNEMQVLQLLDHRGDRLDCAIYSERISEADRERLALIGVHGFHHLQRRVPLLRRDGPGFPVGRVRAARLHQATVNSVPAAPDAAPLNNTWNVSPLARVTADP